MAYLLDTHVWIWSQLAPDRLGPGTTSLLENPESTLWIATVSTLELSRLVEGGRIRLEVSPLEWVEASLDCLVCGTLEMSHAVAAQSYSLPEPFHRDPADRILVATARHHSLELVTADERILAYPHVATVDARR